MATKNTKRNRTKKATARPAREYFLYAKKPGDTATTTDKALYQSFVIGPMNKTELTAAIVEKIEYGYSLNELAIVKGCTMRASIEVK